MTRHGSAGRIGWDRGTSGGTHRGEGCAMLLARTAGVLGTAATVWVVLR